MRETRKLAAIIGHEDEAGTARELSEVPRQITFTWQLSPSCNVQRLQ